MVKIEQLASTRSCDHIYYAPVVPADCGEDKAVGWYQACDHIYYAPVVPADHGEIEQPAGTRSVITYTMHLWYRPTVVR
jgi:hypothetical protein